MLLTRKSVGAFKAETTPGTAESLTVDEAAHNLFDLKVMPEIEIEEREEQGSFANLPGVAGARQGKATFRTELVGGSANPSTLAALLPACGFAFDGTSFDATMVSPDAGLTVTGVTQPHALTIGQYLDGKFRYIYGALGNVKFTLEAGKKAHAEWEFTGIWGGETDVAIVAPTYPTAAPLRFVSSSMTIGSWSPKVSQVTIDMGNEVVLREDANAASGFYLAVIANRRTKVTLNPEATLVADNGLDAAFLAGTEAALSLAVVSGSDSATFTGTGLQYLSHADGDRNRIATNDIEAALNNDDLAITIV